MAGTDLVIQAKSCSSRGGVVWRSSLLTLLLFCLTACGFAPDPPAREINHPDRANSTIEFFVERPAGDGPWPTVIFLHGHQSFYKNIGGRAFADWGILKRFAKDGYLAAAVSLPGYGNSSGPRDFAGGYSQDAVFAVIERLEEEQLAKPEKILIQGTSLGAVTAALMAARDDELAGVVLISGLYDLPAFFRQRQSNVVSEIRSMAIDQTGGVEGALETRSAIHLASKIKAHTLILNGARDERTDPAQAVELAARINAAGGHAMVKIFEAGHDIPVAERDPVISSFIRETLRD